MVDRNLGFGVTGGVLGAANYVNSVGVSIPHNQEDWISFAISALWAVLGLLVGRSKG